MSDLCQCCHLMSLSARLRGFPGAASNGFCQAGWSSPAGVCPRDPGSCTIHFRPAWSQSVQRGLPRDWTLFLHPHVWQGTWWSFISVLEMNRSVSNDCLLTIANVQVVGSDLGLRAFMCAVCMFSLQIISSNQKHMWGELLAGAHLKSIYVFDWLHFFCTFVFLHIKHLNSLSGWWISKLWDWQCAQSKRYKTSPVMTVQRVSLQSFHDIAYFAEDRQDLLNGMNEFLDCSIVIPPSDVAGKDLLKTVVDFQKQLLAKKKERDLQRQSSLGLEEHGGDLFCPPTPPSLPECRFLFHLATRWC